MNSYERVMSMIKKGRADRVPVCPFMMSFAAKFAGIPYSQYCTDYKALCEAQIKTFDRFHPDLLVVDSDAYREASTCGAVLGFPKDGLPVIKRNAIVNKNEFSFKIPDISNSERLADKVEGVRYLKSRYQKEVPILGWVEAPFQNASILMGINEFMIDLYDDPAYIEELLYFSTELAFEFGKEQLNAGADIIGIGDAVASMVSPEIYRKFVFPHTKELIDRLKLMNATLKYHICGNATNLLEIIADFEVDIVNIDSRVDIGKAFKIFNHKSCVKGNIDPVNVLQNGTPALIKDEVNKCFAVREGAFILSPGCEVPRDTPYENLDALIHSVL
jgi:Uroporphyrinogen-III decarboxylase